MIVRKWEDIKSFADSKAASIQWTETDGKYHLSVVDGAFILEYYMPKDKGADQIDFETNYKSTGNARIDSPRDIDRSPIHRRKTTQTGWHYEPRAVDFHTGLAGSLYNRKNDGNSITDATDYGDATLKFFDASGVELVQGGGESLAAFQARLDINCTKTQVDWASTYDFDIIGGTLDVINPPIFPVKAYIWVIVAPDIPEQYGGSVPYFNGGLPLHFMGNGSKLNFDGRGVKTFPYDPDYFTHKIRFMVLHEPGSNIGLNIVMDHFKA